MKTIRPILVALLLFSHVAFAADDEEVLQHHEVSPQFSLYSGDALRAFVGGGFQYVYRFSSLLWIGVDFVGAPLKVDEPNGMGLDKDDRFLGVNGVIYFNVPALLGVSKMKGERGLSADLYTSVGGGHLWIGPHKEPFGLVGGGMVLHTPISWLAFRFDLKGLFYQLQNSQGSNFVADMILNIGPSFTF